ncbi:MAG: arylsulfatase [Pseudomonadales bacterium]
MKENKLRERSLILLAILGMTALFFGCSEIKETQAPEAQAVDRRILPLPDPEFKGKIEMRLDASTPDWPEAVKAPKGAPNVLLIMGDDIGFGHMGSFGGPAETPNFDRIAEQGLRFNNFHMTPVCAASRAALITGRNAHTVGMGMVPEFAAGFPGYNATYPQSTADVLQILRLNGYGTAWIGKSDSTPIHETTTAGPFTRWPTRGADYFYGFFGPGVSQWYPPLWENTRPVRPPKTPEEGYIFEADMADKAIGFIQQNKTIHPDRPWVMYYAPAGHKPPIAAPEDLIKKNRGRFDDGYDKMRERILARQLKLGVVPKGTKLAPWPERLPTWDELSDLDKKVGARWMEVFNAAVEHTDQQIGRVLDAIEEMGDRENTVVIWIAGDNGASPEGGLHGIMNKMTYTNSVTETLEDLAKNMDTFGTPASHGSYPAAWGYATSTPYNYGKMVASGGAISSGMAISWPGNIKDPGGIRPQFTHLIDVVPTILDIVGVPEPRRVNGIEQKPMEGVSMKYAIADADAEDLHTEQYFELTGGRAMAKDGWWAITRHGLDGVSGVQAGPIPAFEDDVWELFNKNNDFSLSTNLAAKHPEKLKELQALFDIEARKYNVYPMADNARDFLKVEKPKLVEGNKVSYGPGTIRLPEDAVIDIKNRSFSIIAEVENLDGKAEGLLVTNGGETGGYALTVQDGKPTFHSNYLSLERYKIASNKALPKGKSRIRVDFVYDGGGWGKGGTGALSLNGKKVGEGRIEKTVPFLYAFDESFDVGEDWGTPVSPSYKVPFEFTGNIKRVTIEAK